MITSKQTPVHIVDALTKGRNTCLVHTVDTDIVMILVGKFHCFTTLNLNANIWVAFGSRRNFSFLHINTICKTWEERNLWHCHFFTALLDVILLLLLQKRETTSMGSMEVLS